VELSRNPALEVATVRAERCASLDGFTLHAAMCAALHLAGGEALLRYVLRSPFAQQWLERMPLDVSSIRVESIRR
jgi:hypothetical protein